MLTEYLTKLIQVYDLLEHDHGNLAIELADDINFLYNGLTSRERKLANKIHKELRRHFTASVAERERN